MTQNLSSSILISTSILIFFLLILPAFDNALMLRNSIEERENILSETREVSDRINSLSQEIELRDRDIDNLDKLLPKEKQVPELLSSIESIVSASGLILTEMNFSDVSGKEGSVKKVNSTMKLTGSFASFMNFLDLLERNLRLIDVAALDVAAQVIEGTKAINYDVRLEVNYLTK